MDRKNGRIQVKKDGQICYPIWLEADFGRLEEALTEIPTQNKKLCIVTDTVIAELYAEQLQAVLEKCCKSVSLFVFPAGEEYKTLNTVRNLYEYLILEKFDRKDMLLALGGGVVGDLTGFAAATYLRGIDFIQVPTTLLSQVDSSIGGKTGVDFDAYKNMVGAFHMPRLVYMNLATLRTLPGRQFSSGMAEIIKHGLIQDSSYYSWLAGAHEKIMDGEYEALLHMIEGSCRIKQHVVEEDPTEQGIRAWLNFGHTAGHAVEKLKNFGLTHGECVAIGSVTALWLSWKRGNITENECRQAEQMLETFGLPVRVSGLIAEDILETTKLDKKMEAGKIKFVLLKQIGEACIMKDLSDGELLQAIRYICGENSLDKENRE